MLRNTPGLNVATRGSRVANKAALRTHGLRLLKEFTVTALSEPSPERKVQSSAARRVGRAPDSRPVRDGRKALQERPLGVNRYARHVTQPSQRCCILRTPVPRTN
jgi:hypothetical protein